MLLRSIAISTCFAFASRMDKVGAQSVPPSCLPGTFFNSSNKSCDPCPQGTYTDKPNLADHCNPCSSCTEGRETTSKCEKWNNTKCDCQLGDYDTGQGCKQVTEDNPKHYCALLRKYNDILVDKALKNLSTAVKDTVQKIWSYNRIDHFMGMQRSNQCSTAKTKVEELQSKLQSAVKDFLKNFSQELSDQKPPTTSFLENKSSLTQKVEESTSQTSTDKRKEEVNEKKQQWLITPSLPQWCIIFGVLPLVVMLVVMLCRKLYCKGSTKEKFCCRQREDAGGLNQPLLNRSTEAPQPPQPPQPPQKDPILGATSGIPGKMAQQQANGPAAAADQNAGITSSTSPVKVTPVDDAAGPEAVKAAVQDSVQVHLEKNTSDKLLGPEKAVHLPKKTDSSGPKTPDEDEDGADCGNPGTSQLKNVPVVDEDPSSSPDEDAKNKGEATRATHRQLS